MPRKTHKNKAYSMELKTRTVGAYPSGKGSQREICKEYGISDNRVLSRWILWYSGHGEFKGRSSAEGEIYRTKGRKTTHAERAEIAVFCMEHNKDYGLAVKTRNVSYQQLYARVRKYEEGGADRLKENRDRTKPAEEMTEAEKLKAEMKLLEAKNRHLEIENAFIKNYRIRKATVADGGAAGAHLHGNGISP